MKKIYFYNLSFFILFVNVACGDLINVKVEHHIQKLSPYLQEFLDDDSSRGIQIDVSDLVMTTEDIPRADVFGVCQFKKK